MFAAHVTLHVPIAPRLRTRKILNLISATRAIDTPCYKCVAANGSRLIITCHVASQAKLKGEVEEMMRKLDDVSEVSITGLGLTPLTKVLRRAAVGRVVHVTGERGDLVMFGHRPDVEWLETMLQRVGRYNKLPVQTRLDLQGVYELSHNDYKSVCDLAARDEFGVAMIPVSRSSVHLGAESDEMLQRFKVK